MCSAIWNNDRAFNLHQGAFPFTLSHARHDLIAYSRDKDASKSVNLRIPV